MGSVSSIILGNSKSIVFEASGLGYRPSTIRIGPFASFYLEDDNGDFRPPRWIQPIHFVKKFTFPKSTQTYKLMIEHPETESVLLFEYHIMEALDYLDSNSNAYGLFLNYKRIAESLNIFSVDPNINVVEYTIRPQVSITFYWKYKTEYNQIFEFFEYFPDEYNPVKNYKNLEDFSITITNDTDDVVEVKNALPEHIRQSYQSYINKINANKSDPSVEDIKTLPPTSIRLVNLRTYVPPPVPDPKPGGIKPMFFIAGLGIIILIIIIVIVILRLKKR